MVTIEGNGGIKVSVVADSKTVHGKRITTFELNYPRFIHAEFMTHRMLSRNSASSRAIPTETLVNMVRANPASPVHWGANQPGMQANNEVDSKVAAEGQWKLAASDAVDRAIDLKNLGLHKQIVNRVLEPFQFIKVVATATEWANFFHLRKHEDAQPEIQELAQCMYEALDCSNPKVLKKGEWHVPYVDTYRDREGTLIYAVPAKDGDYTHGAKHLPGEEAVKVSASCCAQVSYRLADNSLAKALAIYDKLVKSTPVHASPFEHQATPMDSSVFGQQVGATHVDMNGKYWSGNFCGWIQNRQLISGHVKEG